MGSNSTLANEKRGGGFGVKLPKHVRVGSHYYKVIFPYHFKERNDSHAQIDYELLEMRITDVDFSGNPRPPSRVLESFWHEVEHAIDHEYLNDRIIEKFGDDAIATLAKAQLQVLHDNFFVVVPPVTSDTKDEPKESEENDEVEVEHPNGKKKLFKASGNIIKESDGVFMALWNEAHFPEEVIKVMF